MIFETKWIIISLLCGIFLGAGGSAVYVKYFNPSHNGVIEIAFKESNTVNRFTIYKDRLHLMVGLPVVGASGDIKELLNAENKSANLPRATHSKDNPHTTGQ